MTSSSSTVDSLVYHYGVDAISALQSSLPEAEDFFMDVSRVFDPKYVFTVYFPVAFALQWALGVRLLGTIVVVEWLNQILKWLMHGDRPYWWVQQVQLASNSSSAASAVVVSEIAQFKSTCETGPGMPSGHSMAMSAAWYVVVHALAQRLRSSPTLSPKTKEQTTQLLWTLYGAIQAVVILSRMYIAAHFPHQCLLGLLLGISVARQIYGDGVSSPLCKWLNFSRSQWLSVASFILASAVGTYAFLLVTGQDPSWSIAQAVKFCAKRDYIHVDTTPFYSLTRYSGAAFGLGLGLTSAAFARTDRSRFGRLHVVLTMVLGLCLGQFAELAHVAIPKTNEVVFYGLEFALNAALPFSVIALAPYAVQSLLGSSKTKSS